MGFLQSYVTVFAAVLLACTCGAQRPFYASSNPYPGVLPQNMPANNSGDLDQRFGGETTPDPYKKYEKDPVYNVDKDLVDRVKGYPQDKQPFWYVNAAHLNSSRYQQQPQQSQQQQEQLMQQQSQTQQLQAQIRELNEQLKRLQETVNQGNGQQRQAPRN